MRTFLYLQVLALILISPHSLVHGYISSSNLFARNLFSHRQLPSHGSTLFSTFEESILGSTLLFEANPPILTFGQIEIDQIERLKVLAEKEFPLDEYLTYDMPNHTPLGCTAKEYSVEDEHGSKRVYISKVIEGGNAALCGLMKDDIIIGVTGSVNTVEPVIGEGLDHVRSLIGGCRPEDKLTIVVARKAKGSVQLDDVRAPACIMYPHAEFLTYDLPHHTPLGCTVDESLIEEKDGSKHVFISKLAKGGNAATSGLRIGDVVVGVTGPINAVESVAGKGIELVQSLIVGCKAEDKLSLVIARGTDVMTKHEEEAYDLCIIPDDKDKDMLKCIDTLYHSEYLSSEDSNDVCEDDNVECMLDILFDNMYENLDEVKLKGCCVGNHGEEKVEGASDTEVTGGWSWTKN